MPEHADSPLDAIRSRAARVTYALGEDAFGKPLPASALDPAFDTEAQRVDAGRTWTYDGTLTVTDAEAGDDWTFVLHYSGTPPLRPKVLLDGEDLFPLVPGWDEYFMGGLLTHAADGLSVRRKTLKPAGGAHRLSITAPGGDTGQSFRLRRITAATRAQDVAEAVRAARVARDVVLFAYEDAIEGQDRTTSPSPATGGRLIEAVTAANPRTTVVLNTSSATSMPWLERTGAVLQMYYPGQEGAAATAAVLFGERDPGGRLTQSFPADDAHHPVAGDPRRYPGVAGTEHYTEGVHVGHRWYDRRGRTAAVPLRPRTVVHVLRLRGPGRALDGRRPGRRLHRPQHRPARRRGRAAGIRGTGPGPPARAAGTRTGRLPAARPAGGRTAARDRTRRAAHPVLLGPEGPRLGARHRPAHPVDRDVVTGSAAADERTGGRLKPGVRRAACAAWPTGAWHRTGTNWYPLRPSQNPQGVTHARGPRQDNRTAPTDEELRRLDAHWRAATTWRPVRSTCWRTRC
ncbi:hypothetical protein GCM10011428_51890 [Streptomyces violaceus]